MKKANIIGYAAAVVLLLCGLSGAGDMICQEPVGISNVRISELPLKTLSGYSASVFSVSFSPDGAKLATGSGDNTFNLWDSGSGRLISKHYLLPEDRYAVYYTFDKPYVFLLDEVDQFVTSERKQRDELFAAMRKLKDEGKAFFIMAGYWHFYMECLDYSSPLYNFWDRILIKSLDRQSAAELLVSPMKRLGIRWASEELMNRALDMTNCRADLIQMICSKMLEHLPKIGRRTLEPEDFEYAIHTAEIRDHIKSPVQKPTMTKKEQLLVYSTIAEEQFTHQSVIKTFDSFGISMTTDEFTKACQKLELTNLTETQENSYIYNSTVISSFLKLKLSKMISFGYIQNYI